MKNINKLYILNLSYLYFINWYVPTRIYNYISRNNTIKPFMNKKNIS